MKEEVSPSGAHIPLSTPLFLHGLTSVKEEAPPSCACSPLATNSSPPPNLNPHDPYFDDGSCMVEEEIPPSWKVEENTAAANKITT